MRTKTLLLTAAIGAAGVATSMAQVFSVNAVGYVNLTIERGFQMIANPLDANPSGNDMLSSLFPSGSLPNGTVVYKYAPATGFSTHTLAFGNWNPDTSLNPGEGVFIRNSSAAAVNVTFVGEVPQGTLNNDIPQGFSIKASIVPQQGPLSGTGADSLQFPAANGDRVYKWNATTQSYSTHTFAFGAWNPVPVINVGESFWVQRAGAATTWSRNFSVNQ